MDLPNGLPTDDFPNGLPNDLPVPRPSARLGAAAGLNWRKAAAGLTAGLKMLSVGLRAANAALGLLAANAAKGLSWPRSTIGLLNTACGALVGVVTGVGVAAAAADVLNCWAKAASGDVASAAAGVVAAVKPNWLAKAAKASVVVAAIVAVGIVVAIVVAARGGHMTGLTGQETVTTGEVTFALHAVEVTTRELLSTKGPPLNLDRG
jgi:hypothetical protein